METSNKLLLSLKQDLRILNKIGEEIIEKLPIFKLNSWLYPGKSYKEVSESNHISKGKQYLGFLELMIDRLYLIINLAINYIESLTKEPKPKNIVRPHNLSLGTSTNLLWKKLLDLNDRFVVDQKKILRNKSEQEIFNKSTQTNTYSSNICNSCATANSCMKEILKQLEIHTNAKFVTKIRKHLHDEIYDITQHGCMNRLTSAILKDVNIVLEHFQTVQRENNEFRVKIRKQTIKYGESLKIIRNLERLLRKIRKCSRDAKIKNKELTKKFNDVVEVNEENINKLAQEKIKIKTLEQYVQETTGNVVLLSTNNENLRKDVAKASSEKANISNERDMWKKRFSEIYLQNRELNRKFEDIRDIKKSMNKIGENCEKLCPSLEETNLILLHRTEKFERLLKSLYKNVQDNKSFNKARDVDTRVIFDQRTSKAFQITGDPIADMRMQVEVNMCNIRILERNNTELLQTIHRVQAKILPINLI